MGQDGCSALSRATQERTKDPALDASLMARDGELKTLLPDIDRRQERRQEVVSTLLDRPEMGLTMTVKSYPRESWKWSVKVPASWSAAPLRHC